MRIERALKLRDSAVSQLRSIYETAPLISATHGELLDYSGKVYRETLGKAPRWARDHARGYESALRDGLYRAALIHGGYCRGLFCSTDSRRADYYVKQGISPPEYAAESTLRGHYWNPAFPGGVGKPFFISESN